MFWVHDKFGNGSVRLVRSTGRSGRWACPTFGSSSPSDTFISSGPPNPCGSLDSPVLLGPSDPLTRLGCQVGSACLCLQAHPDRQGRQSYLGVRARPTHLCRRVNPVYLGRWANPTHLGRRAYLSGVGCRAWPTCLSCQARPTHMCHQVTSSV